MANITQAPIEGNDIVKIDMLGLAIRDGGAIRYVDIDVFDRRRRGFNYYADPYENLYNNPDKLKKMKSKLKKMGTRLNKKIFFAKRVLKIDMNELYEGKGRITGIRASRIEIEEIGGKERKGHLYYSLSNPAYLGKVEYEIRLDEV